MPTVLYLLVFIHGPELSGRTLFLRILSQHQSCPQLMPFQFAINGQTGQVAGEHPTSWNILSGLRKILQFL
jgi:hypothetical protein